MIVSILTTLLTVVVTGALGLMQVMLAGFICDSTGRMRFTKAAGLRSSCRLCPVPITACTLKHDR